MTPDVLMSPEDVKRIAGGYDQPRRQLDELHARGFWRARLSRFNEVILERAHYEAVCAGAVEPGREPRDTAQPTLQPVRVRKAANA